MLSLNHWDMPQGLEDIGGWTSRNVTEEFTRYAYYISKHFGDRVKNWITHNEPWCIRHLGYVTGIKPPGLKNAWGKSILVEHNLLRSHGLAIPVIRNNSKNSKKWKHLKKELNRLNTEVVFLKYNKNTSSTLIKKVCEKIYRKK